MKTKNIIIVLVLLFGTFSCKDEVEPQYPKGAGIQGNVENITLDNEIIYRNQTDKNSMMNSLIRYNYTDKKYILDISEQDALSIGITSEIYERVQKRVEQMNKINKEHL